MLNLSSTHFVSNIRRQHWCRLFEFYIPHHSKSHGQSFFKPTHHVSSLSFNMFWFNQYPANRWKTKCECSTEKCIWKGLLLVQILVHYTGNTLALHRYTVVGTNLMVHHTGWISILNKFIGFIIFLDIIMNKVFPAIIINIEPVCHFWSRWASHSIWIQKFEKLLEIQIIIWLIYFVCALTLIVKFPGYKLNRFMENSSNQNLFSFVQIRGMS